jgi:membrane fusion protein (multidrug efflux system)
MKRILCSSTAIILLLYIFISACSSKTKEAENTPQTFQVAHPIVLDTSYTKEYVAEIQSIQNVEIRARVKGFIEKICVDEGKPVKAGQILFTLSSREFREDLLKANAQLKSAVAELKGAEVEIKNSQLLADNNIIGKSELDMLKAKKEAIQARIEEANSNIALAKLNLSFTEIKAPFTGVINRIPNKTGSLVDEGTLLTTISNNKEVYAYFNVSENDYLNYAATKGEPKSKEVTLLLANGTLYNHTGKIETAESEFDKSTGNIAFRARFPNPENLLKHEASGKVLVKTDIKNAMLIPQKSTFEVQENIYVFAVDEKNKVQQRKINPIARLPHLYVIEQTLTANDKIIYEGIQKVKDGDVIIPETVSFSQMNNLKN